MIAEITLESLITPKDEPIEISTVALEDVEIEFSDFCIEASENELLLNTLESASVVLEGCNYGNNKILEIGKKLAEALKKILKFIIKSLVTLYDLVTIPIRFMKNLIVSKKLDKAIAMTKFTHEKHMENIDEQFKTCAPAQRIILRRKIEEDKLLEVDNHIETAERLCEYLESLPDENVEYQHEYAGTKLKDVIGDTTFSDITKNNSTVNRSRISTSLVDNWMTNPPNFYNREDHLKHLESLITFKGLDAEKHAAEIRKRIKKCEKISEEIATLIGKKQVALSYINPEDRSLIMQFINALQDDVANLQSCTIDDVKDIQNLECWCNNYLIFLGNLKDAEVDAELKKSVA